MPDSLEVLRSSRAPVIVNDNLPHMTRVICDGARFGVTIPADSRLVANIKLIRAPAPYYEPRAYVLERGSETPMIVVEHMEKEAPERIARRLSDLGFHGRRRALCSGFLGMHPDTPTIVSYLKGPQMGECRFARGLLYYDVKRGRNPNVLHHPLADQRHIQEKRVDGIASSHKAWLAPGMPVLPLLMLMSDHGTIEITDGPPNMVLARIPDGMRLAFDFECVKRPANYEALTHRVRRFEDPPEAATQLEELLVGTHPVARGDA
jgi:hypothetical protein